MPASVFCRLPKSRRFRVFSVVCCWDVRRVGGGTESCVEVEGAVVVFGFTAYCSLSFAAFGERRGRFVSSPLGCESSSSLLCGLFRVVGECVSSDLRSAGSWSGMTTADATTLRSLVSLFFLLSVNCVNDTYSCSSAIIGSSNGDCVQGVTTGTGEEAANAPAEG